MLTLNHVEMTAACSTATSERASKGDMKVKVIIWPDGRNRRTDVTADDVADSYRDTEQNTPRLAPSPFLVMSRPEGCSIKPVYIIYLK